jgi:hypothetical protein
MVGGLGSSCSSQRTQRMEQQQSQQQQQQQQQSVPLLPPVATVRLPGKVSSIAFSPDMQGVISIGDYDGTLTQVGWVPMLIGQDACVTDLQQLSLLLTGAYAQRFCAVQLLEELALPASTQPPTC